MINKKLLSIFIIFSITFSACSNNSTAYKNTEVIKPLSQKQDSQLVSEHTSDTSNSSNNSSQTNILDNNVQKFQEETSKEPVIKETNNASLNTDNLDRTEREWFFIPNSKGLQPEEPEEILDLIKKKNTYYIGDTSSKYLYLTFDEGYENGYTTKILDVLKENHVKVAFFVTKSYINANKDLIKRMVEEGHLVCNHSVTHQSMAKLAKKNKADFDKEFLDTEKAFEEATGVKMQKFFRPPMGAYSELSLFYTQDLGYKTIFWSLAYGDYDIDKQPSIEYAKKIILERTHYGSIILLHAISKTNTEILDYLIKEWKNKDFEFKQLTDIP